MTRVLPAMAGAPVGGAETFFTRLAVALQRAGLDQRLVIRPDPVREAALQGAGIEIATARFGGRLDMTTRRRFRRLIAEWRPDLVLTWMNRATAFCPRAGTAGTPRFVHVATPRGYYGPKYYRNCDHLIVTTDDLVRFYADAGWPEGRLTRIPNFVPDTPAEAAPRSAFATPRAAPLLLALGRLHVNKGFDVLLDAAAALPRHHLWIGGIGPEERALKRQAESLGIAGRVRFLGWQPDIAPLFAAADAFICSSRHEPFGNIVVEAWAHRTPVVAVAAEGPGSLIRDGVDGLLVPVDDADALASAIRRLETEKGLAEALASGGRAAFEAGHTEAIVVGRYLALFEELAG